ncbi:hypothetical protein [Aeromonas veronii]|uniref:hypothetical protein n=1 Tax=Aeromonas veronii TaxID=654 RepID=UPI003D23612A
MTVREFMKQMVDVMAFEDLIKLAVKANGRQSCVTLNDFIGDREETQLIMNRVLDELDGQF